ncbi:mediator of DNA damage checkpoint protein 1-like isoform X2 [Anthonomus grandis grandis]|nr:mediator of DNA damage checkpoint protein 1-like isoform X2 [Anthonomus grandis grandis]
MKLSTLLVAVLATCAIETRAYTRVDRSVGKQASNADQMVQNILQWLQGNYAQNSRRIRQGTLREYLPPANTEKPRPFGYPPSGITPEVPFPFPTNPATGGVTAPEGYEPSEGDNNIAPPQEGSGTGAEQPEVPANDLLPSAGPSTVLPEQPSETTGGPPVPSGPAETEQPGPAPTAGQPVPENGAESTPGAEATPAPEGRLFSVYSVINFKKGQPAPEVTASPEQPAQPEEPGSTPEQPQPTPEQPSQPDSTPEQPQPTPEHEQPQPEQPEPTPELPGFTPEQPEPIPEQPEVPGSSAEQPEPTPELPGSTPEQPGQPEPTPEQPGQPELPGLTPEQPEPTPEQPGQPEPTPEQPEATPDQPEPTAEQPKQPEVTPEQPEPTPEQPEVTPEQPGQPETLPEQPELPADGSEIEGTVVGSTSAPAAPGSTEMGAPESTPSSSSAEPGISTLVPVGTLVPSGFTTSTPAPIEGGSTVAPGPEANTIPGPQEPSVVDEEDLKHPPHIHALDVQCGKEMMTINIEFNREFNGVIYSKGYYSNPECLYVKENSGQTKYSFTVNLEMCGTQFVTAGEIADQSYLENVLVIQNESGIQEVWDTVRSVRCLWGQNVKDTLSVAFSIGMLSQEIVTFSGDVAMAKLDVVLGRGPFGEPANGLVKIGEEMTLVVSVSGDPTFDLQVKDCKALDTDNKNSIALTDEDGCILKPKLFGAFQKTRETGNSGASIISYAHFNAFKFPDEMDLMIECNIELCKNDCDICPIEGQQVDPAKRRRRRDVSNSTGDWITMGKLIKVILPEDLNQRTALEVTSRDHVCMTTTSFVFSGAVLVSLLVLTSFICICLWMKRREKMYLKY